MNVRQDNILQFVYTPGKYFVIPDFQRPYCWDKSNIKAFLTDIDGTINKSKRHFFGSIVYITEGHDSVIIDGQQRATTVLLMLTAIYHIVLQTPERCTISAIQIKENYLSNKDYVAEENRIKLRSVASDDQIFNEIFKDNVKDPQDRESHLFVAYKLFLDHFSEKDNLEKYINALEKFEVVTIALDPSDDDPQRVFESINSTGKALTDGDKIRNFALMLNDTKSRKMVLNDYWKDIESSLTHTTKDYISDFFRYFLMSQLQRDVKTSEVYPEFKRYFDGEVKDPADIGNLKTFYEQVDKYRQYYLFLKFNTSNIQSIKVEDGIYRLGYLKIETPFPFLMRVLDMYTSDDVSETELLKIIHILETYLTRRIICNLRTTGLNKLFAALHKEIRKHQKENPGFSYRDVFVYILNEKVGEHRLPDNDEVDRAVKNNPFYTQKNHYIYFVLGSVDDQSKESNLLHQIDEGKVQLSIEHIMPQELSKAWRDQLGPDAYTIQQRYLHTLPNLTLTGYNQNYSNKGFAFKKTTEHGFNDSPLVINSLLKNVEKWDLESIDERANWWNEKIAHLWPVPETIFRSQVEESDFTIEDDVDLSFSKVKAVKILDQIIPVSTWRELYGEVLRKLFSLEPDLYASIINDQSLKNNISNNSKNFRKPIEIDDTPYFYESNTSTNSKRNLILKLLDCIDLEKSDIKVIFEDNTQKK